MSNLFERTTLKVPSATPGWNLDVWQYLPVSNGTPLPPVIIMAHGLTGTKNMKLDFYADAFARNGYACLVFDYRRWGDSDGQPRCQLSIAEQHQDYRTVVEYARKQQGIFDGERVVLWGTSYSGGHVLTLAREPEAGVKPIVVMAQCPYTGFAPRPPPSTFLKLGLAGVKDALRQKVGMKPLYIQAAAEPGSVGVLTGEGTVEGMQALCTNPDEWNNRLTASSVFQLRGYKPVFTAAEIKCPVLLVAPEDDNVCLIQGAIAVSERAPRCELVKTKGGHMDVYPGNEAFELSLSSQLEFLRKHIPLE